MAQLRAAQLRAGLRGRPEARWALWSGVAGALAVSALSVKGIFASGSSTAAIGFVYVPLVAALGAIPVGIWGAALGHVVLRMRGLVQGPRSVLVAALVISASLPVLVSDAVTRGLQLEAAVREVRSMDVVQLGRAYVKSPLREDRYFLGALAQNPSASGALLGRIADRNEAELHEPMGSLWDVMGENRKGLSVMRLVARHPNTDAATLARLAAGPNAQSVVYELLANPRTPQAVLASYYDSTEQLAEWGLALNPKTPQRVIERLAGSANLYTRLNLTNNSATPREILDRLAADPDQSVAKNAAAAIARRKNGQPGGSS